MSGRRFGGPGRPDAPAAIVNARVLPPVGATPGASLTETRSTRSNTRLFPQPPRTALVRWARTPDPDRKRHETHVPTLEDPPRADPRLSGPHEDCRRAQGALGAPRQGPRPAFRLIVSSDRPGRPSAGERRYRLTGIGTFDALFRSGRRRQGRWIEIVAASAARPPGRVGLVVGRKVLRRAVDRNRFKRKVREAIRRARPAIEAHDVIVRLKRPAPGPELDAAADEAAAMIAQLCARSAA